MHPHDVSKQLALFQALLDTKLKSSYDLVISRWERMCEFVSRISLPSSMKELLNVILQDPTSPLLRSGSAFQLYLTCLLNTGQRTSIAPAVRRRDTLLAAQISATAPLASQETSGESVTTAETRAGTSVDSQSSPQTTLVTPSSQDLAQAVISGQVNKVGEVTTHSDISKFASALDGTATHNPIQVSIVESQ